MASGTASVPQCAAHVSASQYSAAGEAQYDLTSATYYKSYVTSAQVLPGVVIGVLCWIVAVVFAVWLLTLCCRSVSWGSRRTRVYTSASGRKKWTVFNVILFVAVLGVVGTGTWALVEGLRSTDGKVAEFWGILAQAQTKLGSVSGVLQNTSSSLGDLQGSLTSATTLINGNQATATALGVNVPATLAQLQGLEGQLTSGQSAIQQAQSAIQGRGVVTIQNLERDYKGTSENAWQLYRPIVIAVFFGLLILLGVLAGFLALLDRTPRCTAAATLLLWIWVGFVLLLGAGALNLVWRLSRDSCLYGVDFAAERIGGGNIGTILGYYFGRTYIPPQDVSQRLFDVNLTSIAQDLSAPDLAAAAVLLDSSGGRAFVAAFGTPEQAAEVSTLGLRLASLTGNLTSLNGAIQADQFAGISGGAQVLVCCSSTNALWSLWLASVVTGAVAALAAALTLAKVVSAIQPLHRNQHYTPHTPVGTLASGKATPV